MLISTLYSFSSRTSLLFTLLSWCTLLLPASSLTAGEDTPFSSPYIAEEWADDIIAPVLVASIERISTGPAASGIEGHTDMVLRYTLQNSGDMPAQDIQVILDLLGQISSDIYVNTGSLSAMTGSGSPLANRAPISDIGGSLNESYDGQGDNRFFDMLPSLGPDSYLTVDIPLEVADTNVAQPVYVNATTTAVDQSGIPVPVTTSALQFLAPCESISLACAGRVNVSVGTDCRATVGLSTVFFNKVVDPDRFKVEVFIGDQVFGDTLDESHIGLPLQYRVIDLCRAGEPSCWGEINLENKNIPTATSTFQTIHCGEDPSNIETLAQVASRFDRGCYVPLEDFKEFYFNSGDKCDSSYTLRSVVATYDIDGWKNTITIHTDSILTLPLDSTYILNPLGMPGTEAIHIACADYNQDGAPSPSYVENYVFNQTGDRDSAIAAAYPYLDKGMKTLPVYTSRDSIIERRRRDTVTYNGQLVYATIIEKDTISITDTTYHIERILVPVKVGNTCNLSTTYNDEFFPGCAGDDTKIKRTWRILNWCDGALNFYVQWIHIKDKQAPSIGLPSQATVYVTPWDCTASYEVAPNVTDGCSGVKDFSWVATAGVAEGDQLTGLDHTDSPVTIRVSAIDECGNETSRTMTLLVIDDTEPVPVTKDQINTSLIYDPNEQAGIAKVTAAAIDAGSHDSNCGPVTSCVLLEEELNNPIYGANGQHATDAEGNLLYVASQCYHDGIYNGTRYVICKDAVKFCCEQVGEHTVALIVSDDSADSQDAIGWTTVNVEDKSYPIIECTPLTIDCGVDTDPDIIGYPNISQGICNNSSITYLDVEDLSDCGVGTIYRTWLVNGDSSCTQLITVESGGSFDPRTIKWPIHYDGTVIPGVARTCEDDTIRTSYANIDMGSSVSCQESLDTGAPIWCQQDACSLLQASYEDLTIADDDACKKIVRNWIVIDWCAYTPNSDNTDVDASDTFIATDDSNLTTANAHANLEDGDVCTGCDKQNIQTDPDTYFRYDQVDVDGYYTYQQIIKITDDTAPEVIAEDEVQVEVTGGATFKGDDYSGCAAATVVSATVQDFCGADMIDASGTRWSVEVYNIDGDTSLLRTETYFADSVSIQLAGEAYTTQMIVWTVSDGCDNESSHITLVHFTDVVAPSPLCISGLSIATMDASSQGAVIWASDYDAGSYDNCSNVTYYFKDDDGEYVSSMAFDCADLPDGVSNVVEMELWVVDLAGNESSCNVNIRIDDNIDICPDTISGGGTDTTTTIAGRVMTPQGDMVEGVEVELNNQQTVVTDAAGAFAFTNVPVTGSYEISSIKDTYDINGITAVDLVLMQRHILGLSRFDDPYKVIAADANGDERVSAIDLVHIKRLLLGVTDEFSNSDSWRFVDPTQQFENDNAPWPFIEVLNITNQVVDMSDLTIFGIKVGDVNGTAVASGASAIIRSASSAMLEIEDQRLQAGQRALIPVRVADTRWMTALQLDLDLDGLSVQSVRSGTLEMSDDTYAVDGDHVSILWFDQQGIQSDDDPAFVLEVVADRDIDLSEALSVDRKRIESSIVDDALQTEVLGLAFTRSMSDLSFSLEQNDPNPFIGQTNIRFALPGSDLVELRIIDMSGKVLLAQSGRYDAGEHQIQINQSEIGATGVMYYQVRTSHGTETKKMIAID